MTLNKTEKSYQQKIRIDMVISMIRAGSVDKNVMIAYLTADEVFTEEEAIYSLGYLKDHKEEFTR